MRKSNKPTFSCMHDKVAIAGYRTAIVDADCFSEGEKLRLMDFYVANALVATCRTGKRLADYGWTGRRLLGKLEKYFMECCSINSAFFLISRTDKFPKTLERFNLNIGGRICVSCPRGAMTEGCSVEEGVVVKKGKENRVETILRHIRNAIAHGNTFIFDNSNILFVDANGNGDKTCVLLIPAKGLLDFMQRIVDGPVGE